MILLRAAHCWQKQSMSWIDEFITYLGSERGLSPHTLKAYKHDLIACKAFGEKNHLAWPPNISYVERFLEAQSGKQSSSIVRALVAIKVFLRFLYREKYIEENISSLLDTPKMRQLIPTILSHAEIERLLSAPSNATEVGVRDRAILELLYGTGIRVSELCSLSLYDLGDDYIRVMGKGSKERLVPVTKTALQAVDEYLVRMRDRFEDKKHLFLTSAGRPLDRISVWKMVKSYAKKIGIEKSISPHTFRHTYASHLLDSGADVRIIQELLGHAHISSTNRYTHVSTEQLRERFKAYHPRW